MTEIIKSINPATEEVIQEIEADSEEKVKEAVADAREAFLQWSKTSVDERIGWLKRLIPIIEQKKEEIAKLITKEMGKPISISVKEPDDAIDDINFYAEHIKDFLEDEFAAEDEEEKDILVYEPLGVVAVITPWNYPMSTAFTCLIPALMCGNAVILKPSEQTLIVGKMIRELFDELEKEGFPKHVFNMLLGGKETGKQLVQQGIDMVAFTGSARAGKEIMKVSAEKLHRLLLEMGGKDAAIVCKDADIENAAKKIVRNSCRNTGQVCCAVERVYVEKDAYDEFVKKAVEEAKSIRVGNPEDKGTEMGPFVAKFQEDIIVEHVDDAKKKGAKIEFGGKKIGNKGYFFEPTIITNVDHNMKVMKDETFGPVVPIMKVESAEEAVRLANNSIYGLTGSVWTKDIKKGDEIARQLEVGVAGINAHGGGMQGSAWGGAKSSGLGRLGTKEGTHVFCNVKTLRVKKA
jgi:acyl-CoA reductase-like NAD-dependent aldehyde dehydrogenase